MPLLALRLGFWGSWAANSVVTAQAVQAVAASGTLTFQPGHAFDDDAFDSAAFDTDAITAQAQPSRSQS